MTPVEQAGINEAALTKRVEEDTRILREVVIDSQQTYKRVADLAIVFQGGIKAVEEEFAKPKKLTYDAWKAMVAMEKKFLAPYEDALLQAKTMMARWNEEQEKLAKEQERLLQAAEQKRQEEEALALAARLEASGDVLGASQVIEEAISIPAAAVTVQKAVPKVAGVSQGRIFWDWEVVDPDLIPRSFMKPDEDLIKAVVNQSKQNAEKLIPGIKVKSRRGLPGVRG